MADLEYDLRLREGAQLDAIESEPNKEQSGIVERSRVAIELSRYDEKRLSPDDRAELVDLLSDTAWPAELRDFAIDCLIPIRVNAGILDDLRARMKYIAAHIPLDLLENHKKAEFSFLMTQLLRKRISFLEAIDGLMGEKGWRMILSDHKMIDQYDRAALLGAPINRLTEESFFLFSKRPSLPLSAEEGVADRLVELTDVLGESGISELALPLVNKIEITEHDSKAGMSGHFYNRTGDISVSTGEDTRKFLIPAILHEMGHAFEAQLSWDPEARRIFDRYIVLCQNQETMHSPYADSFKLGEGKSGANYITESFAEDFRLFWLKPEALSAEKMAVFSELFNGLLLALPHDEIRNRIERTLKDHYDASAEELLQMINCYNAEEMANKRKDTGQIDS